MSNYLNRYVFLCQSEGEEIILYNSLNGAVVLVDMTDIETHFQNMSPQDNNELKRLGFFETNQECESVLKRMYLDTEPTELDIIIEFTQKCNLRCPYCYQSAWGRKNEISIETLDCIFVYVQNCLKKNKYETLRLSLFGGEPLLQKDKLFYIYRKINTLCKQHSVKLKTVLITNGLLLTKDIVQEFEELSLSITLSNKSDHDIKRHIQSGSSHDIVLNNIKNIVDILDFEKYKLSLRFNTDHSNINHFEDFVQTVSQLHPNIVVDIAYLEEFDSSANYINLLPLHDFRKWNSTVAIDILIKHGLIVDAAPKLIRFPCHGYAGQNIKIFSNGRLGCCDAFDPHKSCLTIRDVCDNLEKVEELPGRSGLAGLQDTCFRCKDFCLCGGKIFCKKKPCDYGLINLSDFLKRYVKYSAQGYASLFSFTKTIEKGDGDENY